MDNPNPIYYKDLITPDNSITQLISQLEDLIAEYDKAKGKIQGTATELAKGMQTISGATSDQRKQIEATTEETDKLVAEYQDLFKAEMEAKGELLQLKAAQKESTQVTKLLQQISVSAEGSYNKLSAQYRLVKIRLNEMSEAERKGTESGRKLEAEAKALYERMNELQKSTGKAQLQVGQYERAIGNAVGISGQFVEILTDSNKQSELFNGILGAIKTPMGAFIGLLGAGKAAFNLFKESITSTQATGDELNREMAGWSATWDVFKKAVATVDFSFFIQNAADAARAGRNLRDVLDEVFERSSSTSILRARREAENEQNLETLRDQRKSNAERLAAGKAYLDSMKEIYDQETETAKRTRDAQLDYLFSVTNTQKNLTKEQKEQAKQEFANYIERYNLNETSIKQAKEYLKLVEDKEAADKQLQKAEGEWIAYYKRQGDAAQAAIDATSEDIKEFAKLVKQYNLTNDKQVKAYVDAEVSYLRASNAFASENRRITQQINALEAKQTKSVEDNTKAREKAIENEAKAREKAAKEAEKAAKEEDARQRAIAQAELQAIQLKVANAKKGMDEELEYRLEAIQKEMDIEIEENRKKAVEMQQDEEEIIAKYENRQLKEAADFYNKRAMLNFKHYQELERSEFELSDRTEREKTVFRLEQEKARLQKVLELNETASEKLSDEEIQTIKNTIERIDKEVVKESKPRDLYDILGIRLTDEQKGGIGQVLDNVKSAIDGIVDSWNKAADAALESANKQVEAAQATLDAQLQAQRDGYAADVDMAAKELQLAKSNQAKAIEEKKKAQQAQIAIDSVTQAVSLITASAEIWKALGGIPYVGPALAIAGIATMWGSFAYAKVKAFQEASSVQYGEGTVELLEGGSHASGNDIDLGRKKDGTRRRAEGGEFFAVINKRNSRKYKDVIPDVINSFNDGTFADKYAKMTEMSLAFAGADLSTLERDVSAIRKQGEESRMIGADGRMTIRYKNVVRRVWR